MIIGFALVGAWPSLSGLAYLAPSLAVVLLFGLTAGLILSALNVYVRDVGFMTEIALQVGFWLCPILYSYTFVVNAISAYGLPSEWISRIYLANPMANAVLGFQRALWPPGSTPEGAAQAFPGELGLRLGTLVLLGCFSVAVAGYVFNRMSRNFAQEL